MDWSVTSQGVETYEIGQEGVETALEDGGVQTHSVLTLPDYLASSAGKLQISCGVREAAEELNSHIDVTIEGTFWG